MKKALFALVATFVVSTSYAQSLVEPILTPPFARKMEIPEICEESIARAVMAVNAKTMDEFPGGIASIQGYEITVRGAVYRGPKTVYEAVRILAQGPTASYRAKVRGGFTIQNGTCVATKARLLNTYTEYEKD